MKPAGVTGGSFLFENRTTALLMGLCPAIAVSARVVDALWMSASVLVVLVLASLAMAVVARVRGLSASAEDVPAAGPPTNRLGALLVSSALTGSVEVLLTAYAPEAAASLGIYVPLIAVSCLVLGGAENAGASGSVADACADAVFNGLAFAACLVSVALVREVLGAGTITLFAIGSFGGTMAVPALSRDPVRALGFTGGGLICLGYLAAVLRATRNRRAASARGKAGGP